MDDVELLNLKKTLISKGLATLYWTFLDVFGKADWRHGPESNRHSRICSPLHRHSATAPYSLGMRDLLYRIFSKSLHCYMGSYCFEENGAPEEIRTPNLLIRSQMLYPVELRARMGEPRLPTRHLS